MTAGRFLPFLVLCLLFLGAQFGPPGLRAQILLRSLCLDSPLLPLPHEMGGKHPCLPLGGRDRQGLARLARGERAARGCGDLGGDLDGPAGSASSPVCGSGVFSPHGTQGRIVQSSQFDSPQGGKEENKEKPTRVLTLKEKSLPPVRALSFFPQIF